MALSTEDLLDRLDAMAERGSKERAAQASQFSADLRSLRVENRYLVLVLVAGILALAGVQVSLTPEGIETGPAPVALEAPVSASPVEAEPMPVEIDAMPQDAPGDSDEASP